MSSESADAYTVRVQPDGVSRTDRTRDLARELIRVADLERLDGATIPLPEFSRPPGCDRVQVVIEEARGDER